MTSMKRCTSPDWLREYRLELGLPADPQAHQSQSLLLLKGSVFGVVFVLIPVALWIALGIQQRRLEIDVAALAPVEASVGDAKARLKAMATERSALTQQTRRITEQLVALRSGSALLEQLRQATPQGIRLLSVAALPARLTIKGEAEGPDALEQVNALALNLEALDDFRVDGTAVVKASANDKGLIDFSIESAFDPTVRATPERLRNLGSEGLARRYELIQAEGIEL